MHFLISGVAGVLTELRNVVREKCRGRGASRRGFVQRIGEISYFVGVQRRCTGSTTVLAEGAARVASVLTFYVHPVVTSHKIEETFQIARRRKRHAGRGERGEKER